MTAKQLLKKVILKGIDFVMPALFPLYLYQQGYITRKRYGLKKGILCISFDNDYKADNDACEKLLPLLKQYHIPVTWSVIGKWVEAYPQLHRDLIAAGHELLNHSWTHPDNSELRPGDLRNFSQISSEEVEEEIIRAHNIVEQTLGYVMTGFRMPHFRKHPQVRYTLRKAGYTYTSNQLALRADTWGMPYKIKGEGWAEIPLSPVARRPARMFETYRIFRSPDGLYKNETVFFKDFCRLLRDTEKHKLISTLYLDACDVIEFTQPDFEQYLIKLQQHDIEIKVMSEVAELVLKCNEGF
jgi:peptidoglycan/xylan/chitin deacetylase (PgdA/CDA1 family)